jgi:hypothetical protein
MRSAYHQPEVAVGVPVRLGVASDGQVQWLAAGQPQILEVSAARVGGFAQHEAAALGVAEKRFERVAAEVRAQRDRVGGEPLEGQPRVCLGGRADIAAFGVQDQRHRAR